MKKPMEKIANLPPAIKYHFDPCLLYTTLERMHWRFNAKILPLSVRKIRPQDTGRRKQFDLLETKFKELYERKTKEEDAYQEKVKAMAPKRPNLYTGQTIRFTRKICS
jgi:hypothetical protein